MEYKERICINGMGRDGEKSDDMLRQSEASQTTDPYTQVKSTS